MDARHFDAFTRALGAHIRRRAMLGVSAWSVIGSLAEANARAGQKKPKKPKKKNKPKKATCKTPKTKCGKACCKSGQRCVDGACRFACAFPDPEQLPPGLPLTLTLQESCVTTSTLTLPEGATLDGAGKTIHFTGPVSGYQAIDSNGTNVRAGLLLQQTNVTVRNLTLDQRPLACDSNSAHSAIVIDGAGATIEAVTIGAREDNADCFRGIDAATVVPSLRFLADGVAITGLFDSGIAIAGPFDATVKNSSVEESLFGIAARRVPNRLDIDNNSVFTRVAGILLGRAGTNVTVRNNTVTGRQTGALSFGIHIDESGGTVTGNTIANFNCGIKLEDNAGVVTGIDPNENAITPPSAGQAICDERP